MTIYKLVTECLEICINELNNKKNRERIESEIITPLIDYILLRIKPYIIGTTVFFITITLLIISLMVLSILSIKKN